MNPHRQSSCCSPASQVQARRSGGRGAGGRGEPLPVINKGCCGGRDYGPVRDEEGPSESDLVHFNRDTVTCPECNEEMYDEAEICLNCGHLLVEEDRKGLPPWAVATGVILVGVLTLWIVL